MMDVASLGFDPAREAEPRGSDDDRIVVRQYIEAVWNRGADPGEHALVAPGFAYYFAGQAARTAQELTLFAQQMRAAFPDWRVEIANLAGTRDCIAARWIGTATHLGPFHGQAPTGKRVVVSGINLYRLRHGLIVEEYEQMDSLGLLAQLQSDAPSAASEEQLASE